VLASGALPLPLLGRLVGEWAAAKSGVARATGVAG